ncbi:hypothetical protein BDR26DRAFT_651865 [Obelidium mucronatum]|nr:hypothetical protein BDR26DRAFT_651865 [Obelidium mucronatum]
MDNLSASTSPPPKDRSSLPKDLESLAETLLGHSIWSLDRVRRTVGVALGSQMLAGGVSEQHPGSNVEIGVYHFVEALKVLKEDSWGSMVYAAKQAAALAKADNIGDDADSSGGTSVSVVSAASATKRDDPKGGDGGTSAGYNLNESNALKEPLVLPPVKPVPVESAESASNRIAKQLRKKGYKLSEREVKMLSTVVTPGKKIKRRESCFFVWFD